jgi:hypothetical protein
MEGCPDARKQIVRCYASLFAPNTSLDVRDGWLPLIADLCMLLQNHHDVLKRETADESVSNLPLIWVCQSKYGRLQCNFTRQPDGYIAGALAACQLVAARTCEGCGLPGSQLPRDGDLSSIPEFDTLGRWIRIHCPKCEDQWQIRRTRRLMRAGDRKNEMNLSPP